MGFKDSAKSMATTLRLGPHYAIERFGVLFALFVVTFLVLFITSSASSVANQGAAMDSRALYTPTFTTSKTQLAGEVNGVYVNTKRDRAMVLMQFKDRASISGDASKYKAYLTGATRDLNEQPLQNEVTGQIVVFGSTGYMAMVLDSTEPFHKQILNLTMRSNSELVYKTSDARKVREDLAGQRTFTEFDQWRLYFNPGANEAETAKSLDAEDFDVTAVYNELVIADREETVRTTLDDQLAQMQVDLARIEEYEGDAARTSVDGGGLHLIVPEIPKQIAGDVVSGTPGVDEEQPSTLALEADWVSPKGFDFDWRAGSVSEGYLDALVPSGASYVTWLGEKLSSRDDTDRGAIAVREMPWALSNGQLLTDFSSSTTTMQPLFEIRNALAQAYQDYYGHKLEYQTKTLPELIDLEVELRNVGSGTQTNATPEALFTY